jgi:hypothetical protein
MHQARPLISAAASVQTVFSSHFRCSRSEDMIHLLLLRLLQFISRIARLLQANAASKGLAVLSPS